LSLTHPWSASCLLGTLLVLTSLVGCASFEPMPLDEVPFRERAIIQIEDNVRVSAVVLSEEECEQIFDSNLYTRGIQPVWLEIENNDESAMYFLPVGLDPEYFSPLEVSYVERYRWAKFASEQQDKYFFDLAMRPHIAPDATRSGFVFSHLEHGTKIFNVDVIGQDHELRTFTFFAPVPGLEQDYKKIDWSTLYPRGQITDHDHDSLRDALEDLPCCVTDKDGSTGGQPLNVVVVGRLPDVLYALIRSGWDETGETTRAVGKSKPIRGTEQRYRPVSIRYVFGRTQDMSFRKSRHGVHPRSHLRLWMTPMTLNGVPVWVGEVGRDLETRQASSSHASDADDARAGLFQGLMYSQHLAKFGFVKRLDEDLQPRFRESLTGAPYYADGYRMILVVSSESSSIEEIENLRWDVPPWE
jgi:hypothetical protein